MTTLIIATRNAHKVEEIRAILGSQFKYLTLRDFSGAPGVVEDAPTFEGNATKKAEELGRWLQSESPRLAELGSAFVLADDSGLEVDALNGAPGVYSARFAALDAAGQGNSSDADNNAKLIRLLAALPGRPRTARFRCIIALTQVGSGPTRLFDGACEGIIASSPSGAGGFGYDPLFVPDGFDKSFAELGEETKNRISHRSRALAKLQQSAVLSVG